MNINLYKKFSSSLLVAFSAVFMIQCGSEPIEPGSSLSSLTGEDFKGSKFYFGFGEGESRPNMANEIKYDILHTHDIFTKKVGGDYIGKTLIHDQTTGTSIKTAWSDIKTKMKEGDMYVQYSSGHGYEGGLAAGVTHDEIVENTLSLPAKEIIIFTMACYSGTLIDAFNKRKSEWENFQSQGKTLLVISSSQSSELSSTGPGTDSDEPAGQDGTAGSAFGHALWKSLIGYADGYVDGVKDDYITLGEIVAYSKWKTQQVGGHTPSIAGSYNPHLIMNRVPPKSYLESLQEGSEGLSDEEVSKLVEELDAEFATYIESL